MELDPAILASPDDDAPRLVWADAVGGERGELVVVQCRLAKTEDADAPDVREERRALVRRERELLEKHGAAWAGLPPVVGYEFRRGFVERIMAPFESIEPRHDEIARVAPLASDVALTGEIAEMVSLGDPVRESWLAASDRLFAWLDRPRPVPLRRLFVCAGVEQRGDWSSSDTTWGFAGDLFERLAATPIAGGLVGLEVASADFSAKAIGTLAAFPRVEALGLSSHSLDAEGIARVFATLPALRALDLSFGSPDPAGRALDALLAVPALARLTHLEVLASEMEPDDPARIAACPRLAGLRSLKWGPVFDRTYPPGTPLALSRSPHLSGLRALSLHGGAVEGDGIRALSEASFAPGLRKLELELARLDAAACDRLLAAFPALERLHLHHATIAPGDRDRLRASIPDVRAG